MYASHLVRAQQTAESVAEGRGLELRTEHDVAEFDRDHRATSPSKRSTGTAPSSKRSSRATTRAIGGPDPMEFRSTIVGAFDRIIDAHPSQTVAVVCHAGVINAYFAHVLGIDKAIFLRPRSTRRSTASSPSNSSGIRGVGSLNETAHLRDL